MNATPTISVIVPVFNVEKFLHQCLDSILAQSVTDFELLLVDDGSTDSSSGICDEYTRRDSRVRVFHRRNHGVSVARNFGLDLSSGVWVAFIDSDDWLEPEYFRHLLVGSEFADLCVAGYVQIEAAKTLEYAPLEEVFAGSNINCFLEKHISSCLIRAPWCKLFKREIILNRGLRFDETVSLGEDTIFNLRYLQCTTGIHVSRHADYYWRCTRANSLTKQARGERWARFLQIYELELAQTLGTTKFPDNVMADVRNKIVVTAIQVCTEPKLSGAQRKTFLQELHSAFSRLSQEGTHVLKIRGIRKRIARFAVERIESPDIALWLLSVCYAPTSKARAFLKRAMGQ